MHIQKQLLENIDPVIYPESLEFFEDCIIVVYQGFFDYRTPYVYNSEGSVVISHLYKPLHYRRN